MAQSTPSKDYKRSYPQGSRSGTQNEAEVKEQEFRVSSRRVAVFRKIAAKHTLNRQVSKLPKRRVLKMQRALARAAVHVNINENNINMKKDRVNIVWTSSELSLPSKISLLRFVLSSDFKSVYDYSLPDEKSFLKPYAGADREAIRAGINELKQRFYNLG